MSPEDRFREFIAEANRIRSLQEKGQGWEPFNLEPNVAQKAVNFTKAIASHAAAGFPLLTAEETEDRLAICYDCPMYRDSTCTICGCKMRVKASWAEQKCPLGKWDPKKTSPVKGL